MIQGAIVPGLDLIPNSETRQYHSKKESIYALPADNEEYDRLEHQHELMLHLFGGLLVAPVANIDVTGFKVLDVGAGPGSWIRDIKKAHRSAECLATDFATTFKPVDGVSFVFGDVLKGLPFEADHFDLVHMRFFTGALKIHEWPVAIKELFRVTKPGGYVQLTEPDGQLRSLKGITEKMADWNERGMRGSLKQRDGEPNAGLRLKEFLAGAGFQHVQEIVVSAPMNDQAGDLGKLMIHDYKCLIDTLAPVLAQTWKISAEEVIAWGYGVVEDCDKVEGFHNFVTATAQKAA